MIKVEVHSTRAVIRSQEPLTVGLKGAKAQFVFGPDWADLIKTAVFRQGEKTVTLSDIGGEVTVPWEVLTLPGVPVQIGVYGSNADGSVAIPTLWTKTAPVCPGADPEGDPSTEPTPGLWEQMQGKLGSLDRLTTNEKSSLVAAINEANQAVFLITVTKNEDGSYGADKTANERAAARQAGKMLLCYWVEHDLLLPLSRPDGGRELIFRAVKDHVEYCIDMTSGEDIKCVCTPLATSESKLPNPKKLTFIGAARAEYDGSEEVTVGIPTKVSQLQNDSGYLTSVPVTSVNGQTGDVKVPTPVKVTVTQESDGNYTADRYCTELLEAHYAGSVVYCQWGSRLLPLLVASKAFCAFGCVYSGNIYTVTVGTTSVTVTAVALPSGGVNITDDGNGNVTIG